MQTKSFNDALTTCTLYVCLVAHMKQQCHNLTFQSPSEVIYNRKLEHPDRHARENLFSDHPHATFSNRSVAIPGHQHGPNLQLPRYRQRILDLEFLQSLPATPVPASQRRRPLCIS